MLYVMENAFLAAQLRKESELWETDRLCRRAASLYPKQGRITSFTMNKTMEVIRVDNIRESLKELIMKAYVDWRNEDAFKVDGGKMYFLKWDHFTDYLLANGVTIQQWIPMNEGLPDPFEVVWVYDATADEIYAAHITYHKEWVGVCMSHEITHWMPPPSVPKPQLPK